MSKCVSNKHTLCYTGVPNPHWLQFFTGRLACIFPSSHKCIRHKYNKNA